MANNQYNLSKKNAKRNKQFKRLYIYKCYEYTRKNFKYLKNEK